MGCLCRGKDSSLTVGTNDSPLDPRNLLESNHYNSQETICYNAMHYKPACSGVVGLKL